MGITIIDIITKSLCLKGGITIQST